MSLVRREPGARFQGREPDTGWGRQQYNPLADLQAAHEAMRNALRPWHSGLPEWEDLDTGIVYEMEEIDLPEHVKRYRRLGQ